MTTFRVIEGGLAPDRTTTWAAEAIRKQPGADNAKLRRSVRRAEKDARTIESLMAPAVAAISKTDHEFFEMIRGTNWDDLVATRAAFRRGAQTAQELAETLHAADDRLSEVIAILIRRALDKRNGKAVPPDVQS
jgi:hypothetical protein